MAVFVRWSAFLGVIYSLINLKMGNAICNEDNYERYVNQFGSIRRERYIDCQNIQLPLNEPCDNCRRIIISDSNIPEIITAAFLNFPSTEDLQLSGNFIKNIQPGAFSGLQALEKLDLHNNQIEKISDGIFNHLVKLKSLDLSRNKISSIVPTFLTGVTHISSLNLADNALKSVDDVFLGQNSHFIMVNLSSNEISSFNLNRFNSKINTLDISNNTLTSVNVCFPGLKKLDASNNQIKSLLSGTCSLNTAPLNLNISYNLLNEESIMNVSKLFKLESLSVAGNNLSFIPVNLFVNLTKLSYLNMSHNHISYLNYGALDHLNFLQSLDLSYNKLTTLKRYLHSLSALRSLYINNNKITEINSKQLLTDNNGLNIINIDSNDFTCENLVEVIHDFKNKVSKGTATIGSNIHGIACKEETLPEANPEVKFKEDVIKYLETTISAKLEKSESLQFDRSLMYDYFNKDFKNSNFYKYLEGLKNINTLNFNGTDMLKYFNQDFKNSLFYKYLESLKANENSTREFNRSLYDYFNNDFNGTYLVKYLTKLEKSKGDFIDSFENSSMFNYFNKGFQNSTFYKYLENLNSKFDSIQQKDHGTAEYFHSSSEQQGHSYFATQSVIIMLLMLIMLIILVLFKVVKIYSNYNSKNLLAREQVELLDTNSIA
ncbi:leucine-rich repeat and immunoglobulin-like domain-containing nogo receptor-interacting protein 2 isoform X1 [Diabrotica virgifera virgifera]|uniref:Leucine-rich repeat-containing protein 15-like n=2 Tax=Diabrotica virgifera virgifera TaxID=50390 RepID=A0ABM5IMA5_DIAVI|nr:leucine-rich repeat and immunoglobulin-like domain-containing nogo receptor-interacting protein 2 isoform X1 [Diabrotica virgifera virgifera]